MYIEKRRKKFVKPKPLKKIIVVYLVEALNNIIHTNSQVFTDSLEKAISQLLNYLHWFVENDLHRSITLFENFFCTNMCLFLLDDAMCDLQPHSANHGPVFTVFRMWHWRKKGSFSCRRDNFQSEVNIGTCNQRLCTVLLIHVCDDTKIYRRLEEWLTCCPALSSWTIEFQIIYKYRHARVRKYRKGTTLLQSFQNQVP